MVKRVFIVHGWSGNPDEALLAWLRKELINEGFDVISPEMPDSDHPRIESWVSHLGKLVGTPEQDTYFIGHSIGCLAIMRYLETISSEKVGGCVFIAGWFNLDNMESDDEEKIAAPWIESPLNFSKIKKSMNKLIVFISEDEPYGFVEENTRTFRDKLGADVHVEKNKGHFTRDDGIVEDEEILDACLEMME